MLKNDSSDKIDYFYRFNAFILYFPIFSLNFFLLTFFPTFQLVLDTKFLSQNSCIGYQLNLSNGFKYIA